MGQVKPLLSGLLPLFTVVILVFVVADERDVEVGEKTAVQVNGVGRQPVSRPRLGVAGVDRELSVTVGSDWDRPPRLPPRLGEKRMPQVRPPERFAGIQILLSGNRSFSDREIFDVIDVPEDSRAPLAKDQVRGKIRNFYRQQGFARVSVKASSSPETPDLLEVEIEEGERYYFGGLELRGAPAHAVRQVERLYPAAGSIVDWGELRQGDAQLRKEYRERGFLDVKLTPTAKLQPSNNRLTYRIRVVEGPLYRAGSPSIFSER